MQSYVISVDPGDTTGLAVWHSDGTFVHETQLGLDELITWCDELYTPVSTIVIEDYRLYGHKAQQQTGSRFKAVQAIGVLKALAKRNRSKVVLQKPDVLAVAALHSGRKRPSNHKISHSVDAYNHGFYWFVSQNILKPVLQQPGNELS
jgi:hypothetical protein